MVLASVSLVQVTRIVSVTGLFGVVHEATRMLNVMLE
jgi:hypothetical protein